jgi:hypothetical protein
MPRHVYRVTVELIWTEPDEEAYLTELEDIAALRARIMGVPGLVKYPDDVQPEASWGKPLRREQQVIELDIDRDMVDEKQADRACLMEVVQHLAPLRPVELVSGNGGAAGGQKAPTSEAKTYYRARAPSWANVQAWRWDGSASLTQIQAEIRAGHPEVTVRTHRDPVVDAPINLVVDYTPPGQREMQSWICRPDGYIVEHNDGSLETMTSEDFTLWYEVGDTEPAELATPEEWERRTGIEILDPDGWMGEDPKPWEQPISAAEFDRRAAESTCAHVPAPRQDES